VERIDHEPPDDTVSTRADAPLTNWPRMMHFDTLGSVALTVEGSLEYMVGRLPARNELQGPVTRFGSSKPSDF